MGLLDYTNPFVAMVNQNNGSASKQNKLAALLNTSYSGMQGQAPRMSDRQMPAEPLNYRGLLDAATNIPVVGDALSGGMAVYDAAKGDYPSAAMNALGVLPFVSGTMLRATRGSSPFNDVPWAMFKKSENVDKTIDDLSMYGKNFWTIDPTKERNLVNVDSLQKDLIKALRGTEAQRNYSNNASKLVRESNPKDIVDSAGIWDNPDIVQTIYDNLLDKKGISGVKTSDGAIVFDPSFIKKFDY